MSKYPMLESPGSKSFKLELQLRSEYKELGKYLGVLNFFSSKIHGNLYIYYINYYLTFDEISFNNKGMKIDHKSFETDSELTQLSVFTLLYFFSLRRL